MCAFVLHERVLATRRKCPCAFTAAHDPRAFPFVKASGCADNRCQCVSSGRRGSLACSSAASASKLLRCLKLSFILLFSTNNIDEFGSIRLELELAAHYTVRCGLRLRGGIVLPQRARTSLGRRLRNASSYRERRSVDTTR